MSTTTEQPRVINSWVKFETVWCALIKERSRREGDIVTITKKDGSSTQEQLRQYQGSTTYGRIFTTS